jgi:hypothetical protein
MLEQWNRPFLLSSSLPSVSNATAASTTHNDDEYGSYTRASEKERRGKSKVGTNRTGETTRQHGQETEKRGIEGGDGTEGKG